jgi:phosphate transport system substrate-binding protein
MNRIAMTLALMCMVVVLVAAIGPEAGAQQKQVVVVRGDAAVANLMDDLAQSFMRDHLDYSIVVSGGAAAGVVEALLSGEAQVGMSAHPISPDGEKLAEAKGAKLVSRLVDWEGLALICHPSNPVDKLTLDEVRNLFTGKIANWSQVKGKNANVDLVVIETPRSGLGTYFNETALGKSPVSPSARVLRYFKNIVGDVAKNPNAIGYAPIRFVERAKGKDDVKVLAVARSELHMYVAPSGQTIKDRSYLLITPLFLFYDDNAKSAGPKTFVDYCVQKRLLGQ